MRPTRSPFRAARVRSDLTLAILSAPLQDVAALSAAGFALPAATEGARRDGWQLVLRGLGHHATLQATLPLNLRDDAGNVVGEVAGMQDRNGDLWALLLWHRDGEPAEAFATRVRGAMLTGDVTGYAVLELGGAANDGGKDGL